MRVCVPIFTPLYRCAGPSHKVGLWHWSKKCENAHSSCCMCTVVRTKYIFPHPKIVSEWYTNYILSGYHHPRVWPKSHSVDVTPSPSATLKTTKLEELIIAKISQDNESNYHMRALSDLFQFLDAIIEGAWPCDCPSVHKIKFSCFFRHFGLD